MSRSVIVEKPDFKITKNSSSGRGRGRTYLIEILENGVPGRRQLELTVDQLFDITEELDEICDFIEDNE